MFDVFVFQEVFRVWIDRENAINLVFLPVNVLERNQIARKSGGFLLPSCVFEKSVPDVVIYVLFADCVNVLSGNCLDT